LQKRSFDRLRRGWIGMAAAAHCGRWEKAMSRIPFTCFAAALALATTSASRAAPGDEVYARPATMAAAPGTRLNLVCMGSGSPAVVFDSGFEDWAPAWAVVQPRVARFTRACAYDRAGSGFSDPAPMPRTSVRIADELRAALRSAGVRGPYILVGSAYGSYTVRTFAFRHPRDTAGLVLVDGDVVDLEPADLQAADNRGVTAVPPALRECRDAIAAGRPLPLLPSRPGRPTRTCAQTFFRGLPEAQWSPALNAALLELARTKVAMYDSDISEMEQTPADEAWLQRHSHWLGTRPIRVLTSLNHGIGHLELQPPQTDAQRAYQQALARAQARVLTLSSNARQIFARHSSEYIQFDEPDTVLDAIREVYDQSRGH
jgi:pimeloyl-ACP methyl ester carboxylesterase